MKGGDAMELVLALFVMLLILYIIDTRKNQK